MIHVINYVRLAVTFSSASARNAESAFDDVDLLLESGGAQIFQFGARSRSTGPLGVWHAATEELLLLGVSYHNLP
jgi:hypothetical protein